MGNKIFSGKKVTVMGLGLLGGAVNDTKYLAQQGADIIVTDLKTEKELASSVEKLSEFKNIKYVLGEHRLEDFRDRDFILQPGNVPTNSPHLAEAQKNNIPVHVSESLFMQYTKATVVGITGTRGKTTVTTMIHHSLEKAPPAGKKVFLGGNIRDVSTLALLDKAGEGDIVVLELDSWALHGTGYVKKSPHIAVFTTFMPDHLNFYKNDLQAYFDDKANIFKYQAENDTLVMGERVVSIIDESFGLGNIKSKKTIASIDDLPLDFSLAIPGEHNKYNAACAWEALRALELSTENIRKGLESFPGVSGRLEFVREIGGVKIYNDTTATTPEATRAGLKAVGNNKNVVLIMGGADKGLDMKKLVEIIPEYCKKMILLSGTGTDALISNSQFSIFNEFPKSNASSLKNAVDEAIASAESGDVILFSPAFASFGMFKNEYDRGDQFNSLVKELS